MNAIRNGLLLAAVQILIVLFLGGKLLYDRATRPRAWVLCQVYDPNLPIRGRYLSEQLTMPAEGFEYKQSNPGEMNWYVNRQWAQLELRDGKLIAVPRSNAPASSNGSGAWVSLHKNPDGTLVAAVQEPVLIFIPDRAQIPHLDRGDQMWVEVTLPRQGPPRPIRLAIKKDGVFTPLKLS
jgi:hypothetical protein